MRLRPLARRSAVVIAAGLLLLLAAVPATAAPARVRSAIAWAACGDRLECAEVSFPLDWDHPGGRRITLPVIRHLATSPAHRIGSLFVNPGGPGDSGADMVTSRGAAIDAMAGGRFDVVGWDTRGSGGTAKVSCFATTAERAAFWDGLPVPTTRAEERAYLARTAAFAQHCTARNGDLLAHIATADTARDLDHLRALVGDRKLSYLGESYGTFIGLTYANLFPRRVRAMTLDGIIEPRANVRGTAATIGAGLSSTDATFDRFIELCEAAGPARCALAGHGPVAERVNGVLDGLRRAPLPVGAGELTYGEALTALKLAALGHPVLWGEVARQFELAAQGDGSAVDQTAGFYTSPEVKALLEPGQAILCADSPARPRDARDWAAAVRRLEAVSRIGGRPMGYQIGAACAAWPVRARDRYTGPWDAATRHPILIVNNRYDPNSPLPGARTAARELGNAVLLIHDGIGHLSVNDPSACVDRAVGRYLTTLTPPPRGTVCPSDASPFDPGYGG